MAYELDLRALKAITDMIFDHIMNDLKTSKVTLKDDKNFYWEVPPEKLFTVRESQPQLDVGSLVDDWEFLQPILQDKDQAVALMLAHVAPILRWIAEEIGQ